MMNDGIFGSETQWSAIKQNPKPKVFAKSANSGTDVMILKYFCQKISKKLAFFAQTTSRYFKTLVIHN
jgi:hypothetical protein